MKVRQVVRAMKRDGWYVDRQRGSHRQFKHPTKPNRITIAYADSKDISPAEAAEILRDAGL